MNVVAIIQARMGSTRLPGKVLLDVEGKPMIERVITRVARAAGVNHVVVATSDLPQDDPLARHCRSRGWDCQRGSEHDVLARYHQVAVATQADVIVRVTGDCPLIDPETIERVVAALAAHPGWDLATNVWPERTFPRGLDTEAIRREALNEMHEKANLPEYREHVTLAAYRHPEQFTLGGIASQRDASAWRLTVDTAADLAMVRRIYAHFQTSCQIHGAPLTPDCFAWSELEPVLRANPGWRVLNEHIQQKAA